MKLRRLGGTRQTVAACALWPAAPDQDPGLPSQPAGIDPNIAPVSRPWLVQARLGLSFPQDVATATSFSPARRRDAPVLRHPPGYWRNVRVNGTGLTEHPVLNGLDRASRPIAPNPSGYSALQSSHRPQPSAVPEPMCTLSECRAQQSGWYSLPIYPPKTEFRPGRFSGMKIEG